MRTILALLAALIIAAIPATVTAKPPVRSSDTSVNIFCDGIAPTTGTGFMFLGVGFSLQFGGSAGLDLWYATEPSGPADVLADFEAPQTVTWDGSVLAASFPLVNSSGAPAGNAVVSATLTPAGQASPIRDQFRIGNRTIRTTGTIQPMAVSGTVAAGGLTFSLTPCFGDIAVLEDFVSNPNAFVEGFTDHAVRCDLSNTAGDTGFLFVDLNSNPSFVDVRLFPADGSDATFGSGEIDLRDGSGSMVLDAFNGDTGEPIAGGIELDISVAEGEPFEYTLRNATFIRRVSGRLADIDGQVTFPGGTSFDLDACIAMDQRSKEINTLPRGPKPGGRPPVNDLPSGAIPIAVGGKTSVQTKGASPSAEAFYPCMVFEDPEGDPFEIPVANTVWYKVTGTGGEVTVDTAGSDFDTVLAVYTANASGGFTSVACVDDVPVDPIGRTLQAAATFPTTAGTTYYVQIGGFPEALPYGNLRVAVR